jgi:superfamily II DNA or RNA helicase
MISEYIATLTELTVAKEKSKIKELLEQIPNATEKGIVFEEYIRTLYSGNGWIAVRKGLNYDCGADVILFHPKSPEKIAIIIQAKNHLRALNFDDTKIELIKFEDKGRNTYNCNSYMIMSLNGFVKDAKELERFNMKLESWEHLLSLIDTYDINGKSEPQIELYAHNKIAYEKANYLFKKTNKVAIVQATGTGKSYIIIKFISSLFDKKFLVLAPQKYVLEQVRLTAQWITQNTIFMTYAKLKNLSKEEMRLLDLDFIILDEFHRCGAELWGKGVKKLLSCYSNAYVLGTSATPIRYLDGNRDMSDEIFDGNVAVNLSLSEALVRRILPMPVYVSALYTLDNELSAIRQKIENNIMEDKKSLAKQVLDYKKNWERSKGIPSILRKYINGDNLKFIVFCENKEHLSEMQWLVEMWFVKANFSTRIRKYVVKSGSRSNDRELNDFKSNQNKDELKLLFVIDMLNEGIHIKGISGVILLRSTRSPRIFFQQIGRAIEAGSAEKQPLIFDFVNNFNNICTDDFLMELNASRSNEIKLRYNLGLDDNCPSFSIYDETKDEIEFFKGIEDKLTNTWDLRFEELVVYSEKYGDTIVSILNKESTVLANWIATQRSAYSRGELIQDRVDKLNSIGFAWDAHEALWQQKYQELVQFHSENGHCMVKRIRNRKGISNTLADWVTHQRMHYKNGDTKRLNNERIEALNKINFEWGPDEQWLVRFRDLVKYKEEHGDCDVPYNYIETLKDFSLGPWVNTMRMLYKDDELTEQQTNLLESIGFKWVMLDSRWEERYSELKEFKNEYGHCYVARTRHKENYSKLANWVGFQRKFYKQGKLSEERISKLNEIGFDFVTDYHSRRNKK